MLQERRFGPEGTRARVEMRDGAVLEGVVRRFAPGEADLALEAEGGEAEGGSRALPAERVACVAFERRPPDDAPPPPEGPALRVHLASGRTYVVRADARASGDPLGFYALPADPASDFGELFFFAHGVNLRESDESIGSLLVRGGLVEREAVERGVRAQAASGRRRIGDILLEQRKLDPDGLRQAIAIQRHKGTRLGEILVEAGLASAEDIEAALGDQRRSGGKRLGRILVDMKIVSERDVALTLANKFHMAFVDLDECAIDPAALEEVPSELVRKHGVLPLEANAQEITVAVSDPLDTEPIDLLRFRTGKRVREVVAAAAQLERAVEEILGRQEDGVRELGAILEELAEDAQRPAEEDDDERVQVRESDSAIIKLANRIILDAWRRGASDVHIEPNGRERNTVVRFRIDGRCVVYQEVPAAYRAPLVSRLKIMADLDIAERRRPQDGKIRLRIPGQRLELRVATIPTLGDEDVVLRLLAASKPLPLERMGLAERNRRELERLLARPYGLLLCVGPTGSGKTTTLHSALARINTDERKIWTAEDPVEITQPGLRQVQVNARAGFTFAAAMRAFLRADPDVIMVGEMRDRETASIGVEAALTGHLVLSTLHTNTAPETVTRLMDIGIDPFSLSDALLGVLAQRLARGLCPRCRAPRTATPEEHEEMAAVCDPAGVEPPLDLFEAGGCEACDGTGYRGRVGLHELLVADAPVKRAFERRAPAHEIRELGERGGMTSLLLDGIEKCRRGETDLAQVLAVCSR